MLHIIFLIIKTIGIVLAVILCALLSILLLALFVPIRYTAKIDKHQELLLNGKISWLFRAVYIKLMYLENEFKIGIKIKIFSITIYDNKKKNDSLKKQKKDLNKEKKNSKKEKNYQKKQKRFSKKEKRYLNKYKKDSDKQAKTLKNQKINLNKSEDTINLQEKDIKYKKADADGPKIDLIEQKVIKSKKVHWIKKLYKKFLDIPKKFINIIKKIYFLLTNISKNFSKLISFLKDEINKKGLKQSFITFKKIIKHILPRKIKGYIKFGTDDPALTGQILAVISMFYITYKKKFRIIPDFENDILECKIIFKGRIRIVTLIIICLKLIVDHNFKQLIKNFKEIKEEL